MMVSKSCHVYRKFIQLLTWVQNVFVENHSVFNDRPIIRKGFIIIEKIRELSKNSQTKIYLLLIHKNLFMTRVWNAKSACYMSSKRLVGG